MVPTQIYLTTSQQEALRTLSTRTGRSQSAIVRQALDLYLAGNGSLRRALLRQASGLWRDRRDLPDLATLRGSFDRPA